MRIRETKRMMVSILFFIAVIVPVVVLEQLFKMVRQTGKDIAYYWSAILLIHRSRQQ